MLLLLEFSGAKLWSGELLAASQHVGVGLLDEFDLGVGDFLDLQELHRVDVGLRFDRGGPQWLRVHLGSGLGHGFTEKVPRRFTFVLQAALLH